MNSNILHPVFGAVLALPFLTACNVPASDFEASAEPLAAVAPADLQQRAKTVFGALPDVIDSVGQRLTEEKVFSAATTYSNPRLSPEQKLPCTSSTALAA